MNKIIFFQSSLPRAGSTLLQNIIGQNPQFHVTPTSGVAKLITGLSRSFAFNEDFKNEKDYALCEKNFYNFCREGINGFYSNINKNFILDKSRDWLSQSYLLKEIYPSPKIICLVRDLRSIFTSFEKQFQRKLTHKYLPNNSSIDYYNSTIFERIKEYKNGPILSPILKSLFNLIQYKNKNNVKLIKYEDLCVNPQQTLDEIYSYLEIPTFLHNFNKINQITYENDNHALFGDHIITPQINPPLIEWNEYLTPEVADGIYEEYLWFFQTFNYLK